MAGVTHALRLFEPSATETWLFQTALNRPADALAMMQKAETKGAPDLIPYLAGPGKWMRGQLPLIYANLVAAGPDVPVASRPYLKTAALRERKRYAMFLKGFRAAITALNSADRPYCLVKGVAVAQTVYDNPVLRHCHDVDVVVRDADQSAMAEALRAAGFTSCAPPYQGGLRLDHDSGLPVNLHTQPVMGDSRFDADWLLKDAQPIKTEAGEFCVPAPALRVVHAWLHRLGADRFERQVWVPDTVLDLRQFETADVDRMNAELARHALPEAQSAVTYLSTHVDNLDVLDQLRISPLTQLGFTSAVQRKQFLQRAITQDTVETFKARLNLMTRLGYTYDHLLPPRGFFAANPSTPLWSLRLRRLMRAGLRRTGRRAMR